MPYLWIMIRKLKEDEFGLYVIYNDDIYRPNSYDEAKFLTKKEKVDLHVFNNTHIPARGKILRSDEEGINLNGKYRKNNEVFYTYDIPLYIHKNINILKNNEKLLPLYNYREIVMNNRAQYLLWNYSDLIQENFFAYDTRRFCDNLLYNINMKHLLMDIYLLIGNDRRGGNKSLKRKLKLKNLNLV